MNDRYLGSDNAIDIINQSQAAITATQLQQSMKGQQQVDAYMNTVINNNQRLADMQQQVSIAQQQTDKVNSIKAFADAGINYLIKSNEQKQKAIKDKREADVEAMKLKMAQDKEDKGFGLDVAKLTLEQQKFLASMAKDDRQFSLEEAKIKKQFDDEQLAKFQTMEAASAETAISDTTRAYLEGGFQGQGIESFKAEAVKKLSEYNLKPEDYRKLIGVINQTTESRATIQHNDVKDKAERIRNATADVAEAGLYRDLSPTFVTIKNLGVTDQAKPHLDYAERKLKEFLSTDNGIAYDKKLAIAARFIKTATDTYGTKFEAYTKYNQGLTNFSKFADGYSRAMLELTNEGSKDYNDLDSFKGKVGFLKLTYGDWSQDMAQVGEADKMKLDSVRIIQELERTQNNAAELSGAKFNLGDDAAKMIAVNAILNPAFPASIEASVIGKNPAVKSGLELAKRYREYLEDHAKTNTEIVRITGDYAKLNLTRANTFSSFLNKFAEANKSGQPQSPAMEQLRRDMMGALKDADPTVSAFVYDKLYGEGKATVDPVALQNALNLEQEGITQVQNNLVEQQKQLQAQLMTKYTDLRQAGLMIPEEQIKQYGEQAQQLYQSKLDAANQYILQKSTESTTPTYGVQPNFSSSSTFAPNVDESGKVLVIPRAKLQIHKGYVTPIVAGANAPPSQDVGIAGGAYKASRDSGRRRHAGVDFAQEGKERSASLVSGTVVYIGYDAGGYGNYADILGDNGYVYRYAHQGLLVKQGERVQAGQPIGYANKSGVGGYHLHFEVHPPNKVQYNNGKYTPGFHFNVTIDPLEHLRQLSAGDSNVLRPRGNFNQSARHAPQMKAPPNTALLPNGGAILNGQYSNVTMVKQGDGRTVSVVTGGDGLVPLPNGGFGTPAQAAAQGGSLTQSVTPAQKVYNQQKPVTKGAVEWHVGDTNSIRYDYNDDYGYAFVRNNPEFRKALVDTAKRLKIPPYWLADLAQQESGFRPNLVHSNTGSNYGLYGWGADSFSNVSAGELRNASPVKQLQLMERYMKENGWFKILEKRGQRASIGEFWSLFHFGTKLRNQMNADPYGALDRKMGYSGKTWRQELELLGKWVGRKYNIPGRNLRSSRNGALAEEHIAECSICNELAMAGTWLVHRHDQGIA